VDTLTKLGTAVEDGIVESIRIGGDLAASAARTVREQTERFVPSIPAFDALDGLPSPVDVAENAFDFGAKLIDAQHHAVTSFLTALTETPRPKKKA
jgi:hypothetical protein